MTFTNTNKATLFISNILCSKKKWGKLFNFYNLGLNFRKLKK